MVGRIADVWDGAMTLEQFLTESTEHCALWTGVYRTARVPEALVARAAALGGRIRLLVIEKGRGPSRPGAAQRSPRWPGAALPP